MQIKLGTDSVCHVMWSQDADADLNDPDFLTSFKLDSDGYFRYKWEDRTSATEQDTVDDVVQVGTWHHVAVQKPSGGDRLYFYLDGLLQFDSDVTDNPPQVLDALWVYGSGTAMFREVVIRSSCPYPLTPFTPGPVTFASAIGKGRWISYML